ncbi:hypothetical protein, partial [Bartonella tribocorum]
MGIPYHTHDYQIPVATKEEIIEGVSEDTVIVPKLLGTASLYPREVFASAEQGVQVQQISERALGLSTA